MKRKNVCRISLLFMLTCWFFSGYAQQPVVDSLIKLAPEASAGISDYLVEISFELIDTGSSDGPVVAANLDHQITFVALKPKADVIYVTHYDYQSAVENEELFISRDSTSKIDLEGAAGSSNYSSSYLKRKEANSCGESIFYTDAKSVFFSFTLSSKPKVLTFERKVFDIKYLPSVYFPEMFPVARKKVRFIIPPWLKLDLAEFNLEENGIIRKDSSAENGDQIIEFTASGLPTGQLQSYVPGPSYIFPHLLLLPRKFYQKGTEYPLFSSVSDLYSWYHGLTTAVENDGGVLRERVAELTAGKRTDEEKISSIFYWVQDNIRYVAFEDGIAGYQPVSCQLVDEYKFGDCKGMANLLKEMLILAGYDARLTWLGTSRLVYNYDYPSMGVDNHMICTVYLNGKPVFLDATEKFAGLGEYAGRIAGREVLIEDGESFIRENIPVTPFEKSIIRKNFDYKLTEKQISGKGSIEFRGEPRWMMANLLQTIPKEKEIQFFHHFIAESNYNYKLQNYKRNDIYERESSLLINMDVAIENQANQFGEKLYLSFDNASWLDGYELEEPEKREHALWMDKVDFEEKIHFEIPEGFQLAKDPEVFRVDNDEFSISYDPVLEDGSLVLTKKLKIYAGKISEPNLEVWLESLEKLKKLSEGKLVLIPAAE